MLLVELDEHGQRLRFEVRGGAAGGVQSSMFVNCTQLKLPPAGSALPSAAAPLSVQSKYALLLDAGGLAVPAEAIDEPGELNLFISHTHADHCSGLAAVISARALNGNRTRVLAPALGDVGGLRETLALSARLNDPTGRIRYPFELIALSPDDGELQGPSGRVLLAFATRHRVPSHGCCVVQRRQKLQRRHLLDEGGRPLDADKKAMGARIRHLRQSLPPEELFDTDEVVELVYTGDTTIDWLECPRSARLALKARVLITEATFLCDAVTPDQATERGHVHIKQIAHHAKRFERVGHLVLTHFSRRYSRKQIEVCVKKKSEGRG